MKILCMANNWVGWQVVKWLREQRDEIVGMVVHPPEKQKFAKEILKAVPLPETRIFEGEKLDDPETFQKIRELEPEIGISALFDYILKPGFIRLFPKGIVNLHPSYLPYNRGQYPNVWSIVEGTPAGVTCHYIDEKIDTGDIIAQRQVAVEPVDTGETLHRRLESELVSLFKETWPLIREGKELRIAQKEKTGTCHKTADVEKIDRIDLDRTYTARDLINVLRARSFPPYPGAYFVDGGRRVYLSLKLEYQNETVETTKHEAH